ncbi:MAG: 4Fe-4S binding protein [Planctomycetota bacterium]
MATLTERITEVAKTSGADLVGFAPISRFANAPPKLHPRTIFPQTKTVIAIALRQPRGVLKAVEEGCYWQGYNCDGYWYLNEVLAPRILRSIVLFLESQRHTSVPVHNPFFPHAGRRIREDCPEGPDGFISLRLIGVACGLGELGLSKVFLTPQFGPRQRIFAVLTDTELDPTPLFTGKICDECLLCIKECEACAMGKTRDIKLEIDGVEYSHAPFDAEACLQVHWGLDPRFSPFWTGDEGDGEMPAYNEWIYRCFRHRAICVGRGCIRSCLDHLEKTGRIEAKFKTPFIESKRWKFDSPPDKKK